MVQAIQQMWQQVGFDVTVSEVEQATIIDDFVFGKFQAVTSYQFGAVDPDLNYVWWSTTTISPIGTIGLNFTRLDDPTIESAMLDGPPHHQPGHPGGGLPGRSTSSWPRSCPTCWIEQYLFSEVADERVQNFDNLTLPDGMPGYSFDEGVFFPVQTWLAG